MSIHDHLKFYNSSSSSNNNDASSGGLDLVPTLNIDHNAAPNNVRDKTLAEKQMEIVEYLKKIAPRDLMASFVGAIAKLKTCLLLVSNFLIVHTSLLTELPYFYRC